MYYAHVVELRTFGLPGIDVVKPNGLTFDPVANMYPFLRLQTVSRVRNLFLKSVQQFF